MKRLEKKGLGRHTEPPIRGPCPMGRLCSNAPYPSMPRGNSNNSVQTVCTSMLDGGCVLLPIPAAQQSWWNSLGLLASK